MKWSNQAIFILSFVFCASTIAGLAAAHAQAPTEVFFEDAVAPIFRQNCIACHNAKVAEGGLNLETAATIEKGGDSGAAIDAAQNEASLILTRASGKLEPIMPPEDNTVGAKRLTEQQLAAIQVWIAGGRKTRGTTNPNSTPLKLPEGARASYAVAVSPDSDFVAFGRGGQLVIHAARSLSSDKPVVGTLDPKPTQVIADAHPDFIHSIAISPDGQRIATGSTGQVKIWRRSPPSIDARREALIAKGIDPNRLLCVSNDGSLLVTVENQASATVLRVHQADGTVRNTIQLTDAPILLGAFTPNNQRLLAVSSSNMLYAWNLADNPTGASTPISLSTSVQAMAALDDNSILFSEGRRLAVWQFKTPDQADRVPEHPLAAAVNGAGAMDAFALSPDRTQLCIASRDDATGHTSLRLWNVPQNALVGAIERDRREQGVARDSERATNRSAASLERNKVLVTEFEKALQAEQSAVTGAESNREKAAQAVTAKQQELQAAVQGVTDHEKAIADAKAAVDAAMQKMTQLTNELEPKKKAVGDLEKQMTAVQMALDNATQAVASTQETQKLAQQKLDERKQLVNQQTEQLSAAQARTNQLKTVSEGVRYNVQSLGFVGADKIAASTTVGGNLTNVVDLFSKEAMTRIGAITVQHPLQNNTWISAFVESDIADRWQAERTLDAPEIVQDRATALAFSADGSRLAIGSGLASRSGQLAVIQVDDGRTLASIPELHSDSLLGLSYSQDGKWLASCGADKLTKLLDASSLSVTKTFEGHTHHVLSIAWQEENHRFATASADATVKIWDIEKGESTRTISGFGTEVTAVSFIGPSPNTVSTTMNNLVRMHDTNNGNQIKQFGPVGDSLYGVTTTPNGKYVIATGQEGIVRIWYLEDGRLVAEWQ